MRRADFAAGKQPDLLRNEFSAALGKQSCLLKMREPITECAGSLSHIRVEKALFGIGVPEPIAEDAAVHFPHAQKPALCAVCKRLSGRNRGRREEE